VRDVGDPADVGDAAAEHVTVLSLARTCGGQAPSF